jgi:hypothetical protein
MGVRAGAGLVRREAKGARGSVGGNWTSGRGFFRTKRRPKLSEFPSSRGRAPHSALIFCTAKASDRFFGSSTNFTSPHVYACLCQYDRTLCVS